MWDDAGGLARQCGMTRVVFARQCGMTPAIYETTIHQGGIDNCSYLNQTHHTQPQIAGDEYIITVNSYISNDVTTIVHMTYLNTNTETHSI